MEESCVFCHNEKGKIDVIKRTNLFYAIWDANPVSNGHFLIIPKKHIDSFFDLNESELKEMYELICDVKKLVDEKHNPDGYNIGANDGVAAGRTVHHLHVHVIPRYLGDMDMKNIRGGIRGVIPEKRDY